MYEYKYDDIIDKFAMINHKEVIILCIQKHTINIINLEYHTVNEIPHQYSYDSIYQMRIFTFY